jgi:hypothetical protein
MLNLNLAYLNDMVFSIRDTKRYFNFAIWVEFATIKPNFDGTSLTDVELHKHLGVIFSND